MKTLIKAVLILSLATSCVGKKPQNKTISTNEEDVTSTQFSGDSAFFFTKKQTDFGPRVPGSKAHKACSHYLAETFKRYGAELTLQTFSSKGYDGTLWQGINIIASYLPQATDRIMLCAHWDSRFIAEQEKNKDLQHQAIDGANDGASGVAVLLEIARQLQQEAPNVGVDLILFDVEDQGAPAYAATADTEDSWCLGSQYWAADAKKNNYTARWGILLDMVGAGDAVFMKEQISSYYARELVDHVWMTAEQLGYSDYFQNKKGGVVTDDHLYVNKITGIPCIDIIDYDDARGGFNSTWHTHNDNIDHISAATLQVVGDVILEVIKQQ